MAIPQKPKLLLQVTIRRGIHIRRFAWSILGAIAAFGALVAVEEAAGRGLIDWPLRVVGTVVSLGVVTLFLLRGVLSLIRWLRRRDETLRFFDKGFTWTRRNEEYKYGWSQLSAYREGGRGIYIGEHPLFQWGAHRLKLQDGRVFKVTGQHGDLRQFARTIRRYAARATGIRMGEALRDGKQVHLHPRLSIWPRGVEAGKHEIYWGEVEVKLKNNQLTILRKTEKGKFRPVKRFNTRRVDNVGGFMEIATSTIRNHQRERFEKKREVS